MTKKEGSRILDGSGAPYRGGDAKNILVVPDLAAIDLTEITRKELDLTYLEPGYARHDYYRGNDGQVIPGRAMSFEWTLWQPEIAPCASIESESVRKHFRDLGFKGHWGAFTQWRRIYGLEGDHASIPDDDGCWRSPYGSLFAPLSIFGGNYRGFGLGGIRLHWDSHWTFVAFRKLP